MSYFDLFKIYECYVFYFIWIYDKNMLLNIYFYLFVNTRGYRKY